MTRRTVAILCLLTGAMDPYVGAGRAQTRDVTAAVPRATANAVIRARVVGAADGRPVRGATIRTAEMSAVTDDQGLFELRNLPPGNHQVTIARNGFLGRRVALQAVRGDAAETQVLRLVRGGVIAGMVLDTLGEPAAGVRVQVLRIPNQNGRRQLIATGVADVTDDTGAFRVYGLPAGTYYVMAREPSLSGLAALIEQPDSTVTSTGGTIAPTYFPGVTSLAEAQRIVLAPGAEQLGVVFAVRPARKVTVSGSVLMSDGRPGVGSIALNSSSASDAVDGNAWANVFEGQFELRDVVPGAYTLEVSVRGENSYREVASVALSVPERPLAGIVVTTAPGPTLKGDVRSDTGAAIPEGVRIRLNYVDDRMGGTVTVPVRANGTFLVSQLAPLMQFEALNLPAGWMVKSLTVAGREVYGQEIQLQARENEATLVLTDRVTELTGRVTSGGQGVPDARVLVFASDATRWVHGSRSVAAVTSDSEGRFLVRSLPPFGRYHAVAVDYLDDADLLDSELLERLSQGASPVSLTDGGKQTLELRCCVTR